MVTDNWDTIGSWLSELSAQGKKYEDKKLLENLTRRQNSRSCKLWFAESISWIQLPVISNLSLRFRLPSFLQVDGHSASKQAEEDRAPYTSKYDIKKVAPRIQIMEAK